MQKGNKPFPSIRKLWLQLKLKSCFYQVFFWPWLGSSGIHQDRNTDLIKSENEQERNLSPCFWKCVLWSCAEVYSSKWNHLLLLCCRFCLNKFESLVSPAVTHTVIITYVLFYWVKTLSTSPILKDIANSRSRQRMMYHCSAAHDYLKCWSCFWRGSVSISSAGL